MDGRHKRRGKSRTAIIEALDRLISGNATHPRHAGMRVRITKEAVAREARISAATLYRCPDLVQKIDALVGAAPKQELRPAEQRRVKLEAKVRACERQIDALLAENLRLTTLLAQYDPTLGVDRPVVLEHERRRRRASNA